MNVAGWIWVSVCAFSIVIANVLLRVGIDRSQVVLFQDGFQALPKQIFTLMTQPIFVFAVFLYGISMLLWFRLIATQPLSIAYPVLATLSFLAITLAGVYLFGESMNLLKGIGLTVTLAGLLIISAA
jgi:multidrug transporter EmrE-like cation transporter